MSPYLGVTGVLLVALASLVVVATSVAAAAVVATGAAGSWQTSSVPTPSSGELTLGWTAYTPLSAPVTATVSPLVSLAGPVVALLWAGAALRRARRTARPVAQARAWHQVAAVWVATLPLQAAVGGSATPAFAVAGLVVGGVGAALTLGDRDLAVDAGDVLAATGLWLAVAGRWPGAWTYVAPVVVLVLVLVRRAARRD